jgi:hypothetical protein
MLMSLLSISFAPTSVAAPSTSARTSSDLLDKTQSTERGMPKAQMAPTFKPGSSRALATEVMLVQKQRPTESDGTLKLLEVNRRFPWKLFSTQKPLALPAPQPDPIEVLQLGGLPEPPKSMEAARQQDYTVQSHWRDIALVGNLESMAVYLGHVEFLMLYNHLDPFQMLRALLQDVPERIPGVYSHMVDALCRVLFGQSQMSSETRTDLFHLLLPGKDQSEEHVLFKLACIRDLGKVMPEKLAEYFTMALVLQKKNNHQNPEISKAYDKAIDAVMKRFSPETIALALSCQMDVDSHNTLDVLEYVREHSDRLSYGALMQVMLNVAQYLLSETSVVRRAARDYLTSILPTLEPIHQLSFIAGLKKMQSEITINGTTPLVRHEFDVSIDGFNKLVPQTSVLAAFHDIKEGMVTGTIDEADQEYLFSVYMAQYDRIAPEDFDAYVKLGYVFCHDVSDAKYFGWTSFLCERIGDKIMDYDAVTHPVLPNPESVSLRDLYYMTTYFRVMYDIISPVIETPSALRISWLEQVMSHFDVLLIGVGGSDTYNRLENVEFSTLIAFIAKRACFDRGASLNFFKEVGNVIDPRFVVGCLDELLQRCQEGEEYAVGYRHFLLDYFGLGHDPEVVQTFLDTNDPKTVFGALLIKNAPGLKEPDKTNFEQRVFEGRDRVQEIAFYHLASRAYFSGDKPSSLRYFQWFESQPGYAYPLGLWLMALIARNDLNHSYEALAPVKQNLAIAIRHDCFEAYVFMAYLKNQTEQGGLRRNLNLLQRAADFNHPVANTAIHIYDSKGESDMWAYLDKIFGNGAPS